MKAICTILALLGTALALSAADEQPLPATSKGKATAPVKDQDPNAKSDTAKPGTPKGDQSGKAAPKDDPNGKAAAPKATPERTVTPPVPVPPARTGSRNAAAAPAGEAPAGSAGAAPSTEANERARVPAERPRFAPPADPAPEVGYAPQAGAPLPAYPGVAAAATAVGSYPSRVLSTGPLANLYTDLKACQVGDVLTIVIAAQATAEANADKSSTRDMGMDFGGGTGALARLLPAFGMSYKGSNKGNTKDSSSFNVGTTFTVTVTGLAPTGNLQVEGQQVVNIDGRDQWVKIKGEVRPYDVKPDNTVDSTRVANVRIEFLGVRAQKKRKGLFDIIGGAFETVLGWLF